MNTMNLPEQHRLSSICKHCKRNSIRLSRPLSNNARRIPYRHAATGVRRKATPLKIRSYRRRSLPRRWVKPCQCHFVYPITPTTPRPYDYFRPMLERRPQFASPIPPTATSCSYWPRLFCRHAACLSVCAPHWSVVPDAPILRLAAGNSRALSIASWTSSPVRYAKVNSTNRVACNSSGTPSGIMAKSSRCWASARSFIKFTKCAESARLSQGALVRVRMSQVCLFSCRAV